MIKRGIYIEILELLTPQAVQQDSVTQLFGIIAELMQQNSTIMKKLTADNNRESFHYNVLPDLSHNIDDFTGLEGPAEAKSWLSQLETTATLHRWTEAVAFETARAHLKRAARNWYLANIESIKDWKSFSDRFKETFIREKSLTEKWKAMESRNQQRGEDIREYFFEKLKLCRSLGFGLTEIKTQIAVGLWLREISTYLLSQSFSSIDDMLGHIIAVETLEAARRHRMATRSTFDTASTDATVSSTNRESSNYKSSYRGSSHRESIERESSN